MAARGSGPKVCARGVCVVCGVCVRCEVYM